MPGKKKKGRSRIRAEFRKNRAERTRRTDWTREFDTEGRELDEQMAPASERMSGKGELARRRTVIGRLAEDAEDAAVRVELDVDESQCRRGRVLCVHGLTCEVQDEQGELYQCVVRRLLRTLSTEHWNVVAAGDVVLFRPAEASGVREGIIERVEPRCGVLSRKARGRRQVIVTNVDQMLVVTSADEPPLKPNLIDRMIISAEKGRIRPIICINKIDLIEPSALEPLVGVYSQMGYPLLLLSAKTGFGIARLRRALTNHQSVVAGQSGVGKSSLLNAVDGSFQLRVAPVSRESLKGRHTTAAARLLPLSGGYVVDTPGIRQFELWDVIPQEVAGLFRDLRPYINRCRFPNCTHTHEIGCAVTQAVALGRLDVRRYDSYCHLIGSQVE